MRTLCIQGSKTGFSKDLSCGKSVYRGIPASHNVTPTESVPVIIEHSSHDRELILAKFGIPMAAGGKTFPLLNVQSEKAGNRDDFKTRRCIVPANGFYEWEKVSPKDKQPYYFSPKDGLFSFAGVWKQSASGFAFTILTTAANNVVGQIHNRMPVILGHNTIPQWLSNESDKEMLSSIIEPFSDGLMQSWKVSKAVNSPKNKEAACINSL